MGFLSFLRVTEPHCSARPGWSEMGNASDKMGQKGAKVDAPSMILVDASSASPPTSNRSEWRSEGRE